MRTPIFAQHKRLTALCATSLYLFTATAFAATPADKELLQQAQNVFKSLPTATQMQQKQSFTSDQVKLGQVLFFDPRLSRGGTVSCNSCHNLASYGVDNMSFSQGFKGQFGGRNVMPRPRSILRSLSPSSGTGAPKMWKNKQAVRC